MLCVPAGSAAFTGDSAAAMVGRFGTPASGYDDPPRPDPELLRRNRQPPARIHWMQVKYDPLQAGQDLEGVLVVLFSFDREAILSRPGDGKEKGGDPVPAPVPWTDLHSEREVFLGRISAEQFAALQAGMKGRWTTKSVTHHENPDRAYDLYTLRSRDGRRKAQISYSDPDSVKEFPAPEGAPRPPKLNLWIRVDQVKP